MSDAPSVLLNLKHRPFSFFPGAPLSVEKLHEIAPGLVPFTYEGKEEGSAPLSSFR